MSGATKGSAELRVRFPPIIRGGHGQHTGSQEFLKEKCIRAMGEMTASANVIKWPVAGRGTDLEKKLA